MTKPLFLTTVLALFSVIRGGYGIKGVRWENENLEEIKSSDGHSAVTHIDMDVTLTRGFFTMDHMKVGKEILFTFPRRDKQARKFLPRQESDSIPFSSTQLKNLLHFFGFPEASPQARVMEKTLRDCEEPPIKGELKFCAASLESLLDFVRDQFGILDANNFQVLNSNYHLPAPAAEEYANSRAHVFRILEEPKEILTRKMIGCHPMAYPYVVFHCHSQRKSDSVKVFKLSLGVIGGGGVLVNAIAACHLDTSAWDPNHISFHVLGLKPGGAPVCHIFPPEHLVWVSTPASDPN